MLGLGLITIFFWISCYGLARYFKLQANLAPLVLISLLSVVIFLAALFNHLKWGAMGLVLLTTLLGLAYLLYDIQNKRLHRELIELNSVYIAIMLILFFYTLPMKLTVIDEPVYWAIMGKSLWLHDQLPVNGTPIIARHLHYTPGMSLIHYVFFQFFGIYKESLAYWAQACTLVAMLWVVINRAYLLISLLIGLILLILLHLQYGSVLARLDVDALISGLTFALIVIMAKQERVLPLLCKVLLFAFLSLIKEIGLYFAITLLVLEVYLQKTIKKDQIVVALVLIVLRLLWDHYCKTQGFHHFIDHRSSLELIQDFNLLNPATRDTLGLFIKSLLLGPIDRLNTPSVLWFIFTGLMIYKFPDLKNSDSVSQIKVLQAQKIALGLVMVFSLYLVLLYELQVSTFSLGHLSSEFIGQRRYVNLGYSQLVLFCALIGLSHYFAQSGSKTLQRCLWLVCLVFLIHSYYHRLKVDPEYEQGYALAQAIHKAHLNIPAGSFINIVADTQDSDLVHRYALQLQHYLLDLGLNFNLGADPSVRYDYTLTLSKEAWSISPQK